MQDQSSEEQAGATVPSSGSSADVWERVRRDSITDYRGNIIGFRNEDGSVVLLSRGKVSGELITVELPEWKPTD